MPKEAVEISLEEFLEAWKKVSIAVQGQNKTSLYQLMIRRQPEKAGPNQFTIEVANKTLEEIFEKERWDMVSQISDLLNGRHIEMKTFVKEPDKKEQAKYITQPKEMFDHMVKINPELQKLKDQFGLTFE